MAEGADLLKGVLVLVWLGVLGVWEYNLGLLVLWVHLSLVGSFLSMCGMHMVIESVCKEPTM